jgi:uroporphyrinogen-III synthase
VRVALTHARGRLEGLDAALEALGHVVVRAPLIATVPLTDATATASARAVAPLGWRLHASRSAVEAWDAFALPQGAGVRLAALGPGTRRALEERGARDVLMGEPPTAVGLAAAVAAAADVRSPIGIVQGRRARPALAEALRAAGFDVRVATVYDTLARPWPAGTPVDAVVLASPSAVEALPDEVGASALLVAIGRTTRDAVRARGWGAVVADAPTVRAVADAVQGASAQGPSAQHVGAPR